MIGTYTKNVFIFEVAKYSLCKWTYAGCIWMHVNFTILLNPPCLSPPFIVYHHSFYLYGTIHIACFYVSLWGASKDFPSLSVPYLHHHSICVVLVLINCEINITMEFIELLLKSNLHVIAQSVSYTSIWPLCIGQVDLHSVFFLNCTLQCNWCIDAQVVISYWSWFLFSPTVQYKLGGSLLIHLNILNQILAKYTECMQYSTSICQYIISQIRALSKTTKILSTKICIICIHILPQVTKFCCALLTLSPKSSPQSTNYLHYPCGWAV